VDTTKELPTVLSFCSGYGGIERGLDLAGFKHRTVAYVEIEAYAIANLANKMEAGKLLPAPIWSNLKTLPVQPFRDKVDLITGGYPCQPFSAAGQRKGTDDPRHLWPYIRKHIEAIRPVQCFFENVEGHISLGLREVISDLESLGYVCAFGIFSAREVGAPHQRKRVYILADSSGAGQQAFRDKPRAERTAQFISESSELADTDSERWAKHDRKQGSSSKGKRTDKGRGQTIRSGATGAVADSSGKGLQRRGITRNISGKESQPDDQFAPRCNSAQIGEWEPEPGVGRVVDGCADRVDRIRMLGNGVVPQTAAKAWVTLNSRLNTTEGR
jgi:DNA (cytosine-5)-methyltransferase 1